MINDWQEDLVFSSQKQRKGFGYSVKPVKSLDIRLRVRTIWSVFVIGMALLLAKILYLQVIERGVHQLTSYENHVELKREVAPRGRILDTLGNEFPRDPATAPIVGYLSEVREDELGCREGLCYSPGMTIGRAGVEKVYEASLRGHDGGAMVEVDSAGREVRELGSNLAEAGNDLYLSLDSRLQKIMYEALAGKKGSAVALDMQGKVLGLVSSPAYDPTRVADYLKDTDNLYFLNRAIAGTYPPGSVFKPITAYAGLEEGKITKETEFVDTGEIKVGIYRYGNWYFDQYGRTEGSINLVRALARSNDIFFYKVGEEVGVEKLVSWARKFGLGDATGIELPGERTGLVPDKLWKERETGEKWFLGNTYHMSIGQGDLLVTPLQVARMTLGVVSGRLCQVSVLKDSDIACRDLGLKSDDVVTVREGMKQVCTTGGTAFPFFDFESRVLCKTGTAQHSGQKTKEDLPHAWMVVAYPGENPEMILTVMLEAAGEGSAEAGPVARKILDQWKALGK
jgi:penicillin-binding protein 2